MVRAHFVLSATTTAVAVMAALLTAPSAHGSGWVPAVTVPSPDLWGLAPRVGVGPDGTATVAWRSERQNGDWVVMVATRAPGAASYDAVTPLSEPMTSINDVEVLVDALGTSTVMWIEWGGGDTLLRSAVRPAGSADFLPAQDVPGSARAQRFDLDADGAGHTTAVWTDDSFVVQAATREPGAAAFGSPAPLVQDLDSQGGLAVDVAADGSAAVLIDSRVAADQDVMKVVSRPDADAAFGPAVALWEPAAGVRASGPEVLVRAGQVTAVWITASADERVEVSDGPLGGPYSTPVPVSEPGNVSGVDVAADGTGTTLVWNDRLNGETVNRVRGADRVGQAAFGSPYVISPPGVDADGEAVVVGEGGTTTVVWDGWVDDQSTVQAVTRTPGSSVFGAVQTLEPPSVRAVVRSAAAAPNGEVTAVWRLSTGESSLIRSSVADLTAPTSLDLAVPGRLRLGRPMPVSVTPGDLWPGVSVSWDFGDGATAAGATSTHTYHRAGTYAVLVTVTDAVGNQTTRRASVVVVPRPGVTSAVLASKQFRAKTRLEVRTSEPGRVRLAVQRCRPGGDGGCARWVEKGTRIRSVGSDVASYRLPARIDGERLKPGRYRLVVRLVTEDGLLSRKKIRPFRVLPRR